VGGILIKFIGGTFKEYRVVKILLIQSFQFFSALVVRRTLRAENDEAKNLRRKPDSHD
jgi:hypothetical protein